MEGPFNDPQIADGERTTYRGLIEGQEAGSGELVIEHTGEGGRKLYRQTLALTVHGSIHYELEAVYRRQRGSLHAESYRLATREGDERAVALESASFRGVRPPHWGGELAPYPRDVVPLLGCPLALRGLEFEQGARRSFSVWLANAVYWEAEAIVERSEAIELPVGRREAWRVLLRPSLEQVDRTLDKLVATLMPPIVAHFDAEPARRFLRLEFPSGPFKWNPPGLIEATGLD